MKYTLFLYYQSSPNMKVEQGLLETKGVYSMYYTRISYSTEEEYITSIKDLIKSLEQRLKEVTSNG